MNWRGGIGVICYHCLMPFQWGYDWGSACWLTFFLQFYSTVVTSHSVFF
jgi:hypothetical protein